MAWSCLLLQVRWSVCGGRKEGHFTLEATAFDVTAQSRAEALFLLNCDVVHFIRSGLRLISTIETSFLLYSNLIVFKLLWLLGWKAHTHTDNLSFSNIYNTRSHVIIIIIIVPTQVRRWGSRELGEYWGLVPVPASCRIPLASTEGEKAPAGVAL